MQDVHYILGGSFGDDPASVFTGRRAEINDPVGGTDRFVIVFDDQYGISKVA